MIPTRDRTGRRQDESGMSTAEYAVGVVGACTIAGALVHLGGSDWFIDLIREIFSRALDPRFLVDLLGLGDAPRIKHGP
ncbi:DUF4244 domain-containing protein [Aeromicrobium sp. CTD01-1L150]|uniref:DUF4244 domain-containing protein n=1 Tax=Aeromicrobium sp. CTD01-1L150 TaxID=3341830 RepID=UPI0035C12B64